MSSESAAPRSRRALIVAGLGALGATVAHAMGRPLPASAANGDALLVGVGTNEASSHTTLTTTHDGDTLRLKRSVGPGAGIHVTGGEGVGVFASAQGHAIVGQAATNQRSGVMGAAANGGTGVTGVSGSGLPATPPGVGVYGRSASGLDTNARGVYGVAAAGTGVQGDSSSGKAIYGKSIGGTGLRGQSDGGFGMWATSLTNRAVLGSTGASNHAAIVGQSTAGITGVLGFTGGGTIPAPRADTGVEGISNLGENSVGVLGKTSRGLGVVGDSSTGVGVYGVGSYGVYGSGNVGVVGDVDGGTGVQGWTGVAFAPTGPAKVGVWAGAENGRTALQVSGVARFNRSGRVTFSAGQRTRTVTVPGGVTSPSFGIASLQVERTGTYVVACQPIAPGSLKITLNKAVTASTVVGWIVLS